MKIAIAGTGYVGLSNGILFAQHHEVVALDVVAAKVEQLNRKELPIEDAEMEDYLRNKPLNFKATLNKEEAYKGASFVIIATPTRMFGCSPRRNGLSARMADELWFMKLRPS